MGVCALGLVISHGFGGFARRCCQQGAPLARASVRLSSSVLPHAAASFLLLECEAVPLAHRLTCLKMPRGVIGVGIKWSAYNNVCRWHAH